MESSMTMVYKAHDPAMLKAGGLSAAKPPPSVLPVECPDGFGCRSTHPTARNGMDNQGHDTSLVARMLLRSVRLRSRTLPAALTTQRDTTTIAAVFGGDHSSP